MGTNKYLLTDFLELKCLINNLEVSEVDTMIGSDGESEDVIDERLRARMMIRGRERLKELIVDLYR